MGKLGLGIIPDLTVGENLGTYHVESRRVKVDLVLYTNLFFDNPSSPGEDIYTATVEFYIESNREEEFGVELDFRARGLNDIFERMKSTEASIEDSLKKVIGRRENWRETRDVLNCIQCLERITGHIYAERVAAKNQRKLVVHPK